MKIDISMERCRFIVKPEDRIIVCILPCARISVFNFLYGLDGHLPFSTSVMPPQLSEYYKGIAYCAPEDEWNEELGKLIAYNKAKRKFCTAFFRKINTYFNKVYKEIESAASTCDALGLKWSDSIIKLDKQIEEILNK